MSHRRAEKDAKKQEPPKMPNGHDIRCRCTDCRLMRCEITMMQSAKAYRELAKLVMKLNGEVDALKKAGGKDESPACGCGLASAEPGTHEVERAPQGPG